MSKLAEKLIRKNLETKDPYLDLGNCDLDGTEECLDLLGECDHLDVLVFSDGWWDYDTKNNEWVNQSCSHFFEANQLVQLPRVLPKNLKKLAFEGMRDLHQVFVNLEVLSSLTQLQLLQISWLERVKNLEFLTNIPNLHFLRLNSFISLHDISALKRYYKTQLLALDLFFCPELQDLRPIGALANLKNLSISALSDLSNIDWLEKLQSLKSLKFGGCEELTDLSPIGNLKNLQFLNLNDNYAIQDIRPIKELKQLRKLELYGVSNLQSLKGIEGATELEEAFLAVPENVQDFSLISKLSKLQHLNLTSNQGLKNLAFLSYLQNLQSLTLHSNDSLQDISAITHLKRLIKLEFLGNPLFDDISPICELEQLEILKFSCNQQTIKNIDRLKNLKKLTVLGLSAQLNEIGFLAELPQLVHLSLSDNQIQDIEALTHLTSLEALNLSFNPVTDVSPISSLPKLAYLELIGNQIKQVSVLKTLPKLKMLDLSQNQIEDIDGLASLESLQELKLDKNKIQEVKLTASNLQSLSLSKNSILVLELEELPQLTNLIVTENPIRKACFKNLRSLQTLTLEDLELKIVSITNLPQLEKLFLQRNKLGELKLEQLDQLRELYLQENKLEDITTLSHLIGLERLDLFQNYQLQDFTPLAKLENLEVLIVSYTGLDNIDFATYLKSLTALDISYTGLKDLKQLAVLKKQLLLLHLSGLAIDDLSFLEEFEHLLQLVLRGNRFKEITPIGKLRKLVSLDLSQNPKNRNYKPLIKLTKLRHLALNHNLIKDVSFIEHFPELRDLQLERNNIKEFSHAFFQSLPRLKKLKLKQNPIENIPKEIFNIEDNSFKSVLNYFIAASKQRVPNTEAKIIWLGNGEVGKTTLSHQLRKGEFKAQLERTHGILIKEWNIDFNNLPKNLKEKFKQIVKEENQKNPEDQVVLPETISLKMWDFGGQEYYHATHRLFFNSNVMYLLVWDDVSNHQDEDLGIYPLSYWRKNIKDKAQNTSILEIQNKASTSFTADASNNQFKIGFREEGNKRSIRQYDIDIEVLNEGVLEQLSNLEYLGNLFPKVYDDIRHIIKKQRVPFLEFEKYRRLCEKHDFTEDKVMRDEGQIQLLTQYLHETGTIICYRYEPRFQNLQHLYNYVFTQPSWVTDTIYDILEKDLLKARQGFDQGEFDFAHIKQVLQSTDSVYQLKAEVWQELLLAFELVFKFYKQGKEILVAPQYLPIECSNKSALDWAKDCDLRHSFTLRFPHFLSKSLFLKFIAFYGSENLLHLYWKNGLCFKLDKKVIYATCDYQKRLIRIEIEKGDSLIARKVYESFFKGQVNKHTQICIQKASGKFVNLSKLQDKIAKGLSEIDTIDGDTMNIIDFAFLFGNAGYEVSRDVDQSTQSNNVNQSIPDSVKEALEKQIAEQHQIIIRHRALKNNTADETLREKYQQEIELRLRNITEIKQDFLIELKNQKLSTNDAQQVVDDITDQVKTRLEKQSGDQVVDTSLPNNMNDAPTPKNTMDKDQIKLLIDEDIYEAIMEIGKLIDSNHKGYGLFNDYRKNLLAPPSNFQKDEFRKQLKLFVEMYF